MLLTGCPSIGLAQSIGGQTPLPIIGKWQWTAQNKCTETYEFQSDGVLTVLSGDERTDNTYTIASEPSVMGFYKLDVKVTKDYGGKDCADSVSNSAGEENTHYLLFEPTMEMFILCDSPALTSCFGPLRRAGGGSLDKRR